MARHLTSTIPILFVVLSVASPIAAAETPANVGFNEHVRPILSDRCFFCHGPDEKTREADLRLDIREEAIRDLGDYAAIVPGDPAASLLLERVASSDPDEVMPPPHANKPQLTAGKIALLTRWIEQGAAYEGHWAFLPLRNDPPPAVKQIEWVRNPIDRFVLARLEREGLRPSPAADRPTLIRRAYLDLVGLLPSPKEVGQFVDDTKPEAYERLVDRLLDSPHYGERWGRHWLDQARYADSHGYTSDGERQMWPYRDWVIQALNDDMPFDQFTIEQLAGDLLPSPTKSQLVATAYHRNTLINQEGGTDREQFRVESVMDRVDTTGAVWLGLTVGCARCHSHKFDPIAQREYYQLYAFFNSTQDANNTGPTVKVAHGEMLRTDSFESPDAAELAKLRTAWERDTLTKLEKSTGSQADRPVVWKPAKYTSYNAVSGAEIKLLDDNSLLADGRGSPNDTYVVESSAGVEQIAAVRLRVLTHPSLPQQGPGQAGNGNFVLTDFEVHVGGVQQGFARAVADHQQPGYPVAHAIDANAASGWAINIGKGDTAKMNANHEAVFVLAKLAPVDGKPVSVRLLHKLNEKYLIGRFAIDFAETTPPDTSNATAALLAALRVEASRRSPAQKNLLQQAFERAEPRARKLRTAAKSGDVALMVMRELAKPRATYLLTRGDFTRPGKALGPLDADVLVSVSPKLPADENRRTRLDLARWLVEPSNPLTPRVTMNRLWMRYFGRGLVETENDFGTQGTPPTHPALLDWLAGEFVRRGWSLKQMHRLVVTSATYRQSSRLRADLAERDPRNLLLARQQRLRLEGEIARDAALCASGLLDRTLGGPSVRPPQPDGVYAFTQVAKRWTTATGPDRYRRGLYTFFYRSAPYPLFTTFDAPDFQSVCTSRGRSNTPLQSLTLANDIAFVELARGLAMRLARDLPGDAEQQLDARIEHAFFLCLSRSPTLEELEVLRGYVRRQAKGFADDLSAAAKLAPPEMFIGVPPAEAAALVCLARAVLNTDNFISRE